MSQANGTADRRLLDELKTRVDLAELFRASGVELRRVGKNLVGRCPFHDDREASLSVNPEVQLWNCFGCQAGGDVFRFLQLREKLSFPQALERARGLAGEPLPASPPPPALPEGFSRGEVLGRVAQLYAQRLAQHPEAQQYLNRRGLASAELWETFQLGFADGSLRESVDPATEVGQALRALGVLTAQGRELFLGCVVVPLSHPEQGVVGLYGRKIEPGAKLKHLYLPGPKRGVLNWRTFEHADPLWLTESVLDALSLWVAGERAVSCLFGAHGLPPDLEEALRVFAVREVGLSLDQDAAGDQAAARLERALAERGVRTRRARLPLKDPNQVLVELGPERLRQALQEPVAAAEPLGPEGCYEEQAEGFVVHFEGLSYRVTPQPPLARLKVLIRAELAGQRAHHEFVELYAHRSRSGFVNQLQQRSERTRAELENHMAILLEHAEDWAQRQAPRETAPLKAREAPEMSSEERDEAMAFLNRPDLVEAILADMEALGYVGEERGKLLAYLIGLSRKLEKPLSGIIMSQSGAGKSGLADLVEALSPPEEVVLYSRLTPQALVYQPRKDALKRKLLILEERAGSEAADYSIRVLQSKQRFTQAVVIKDPKTGQLQTTELEVEGPIAYLETTTIRRLNHENATRCFELNLDESEEQTRRIHEAQRANRSQRRRVGLATREALCRRHHNAQRLLADGVVVIPFVDQLSFPTRWLRTRRDHERFLCLVEAVAFLHQHQRRQGQLEDGTRTIEATPADYRRAFDLAQEVLSSTFHELTREARELLVKAREMLTSWGAGERDEVLFTRRDLRQFTSWQDHRLREALQELVDLEYARAVNGSQGRTYHYQLEGGSGDQAVSGPMRELTTPDELEARMR